MSAYPFWMLSPWRDLPYEERTQVWLELCKDLPMTVVNDAELVLSKEMEAAEVFSAVREPVLSAYRKIVEARLDSVVVEVIEGEFAVISGEEYAERQAEKEALLGPPLAQDHSRRGHSPLGASGAERWMNCPGSVKLLQHLDMPESDEPDYRRVGTAMHEAAATALLGDLESYELVGSIFNETVITADLATPISTYLTYVRRFMGPGWKPYIEYAISSPVHVKFYGAMDFGALLWQSLMPAQPPVIARVKAVDLKGGEGLPVEVEDNPQLKYYAFGLIDGIERQDNIIIPDDVPVDLVVAQPRINWHPDGEIREWTTTVGELKAWVHGVLVPAMHATEYDDRLDAGDHCRFCPAKLVCPLMVALFGAAVTANPKHIVTLTDTALGLNYKAADAAKHYIRALEKEALDRQMRGVTVPGLKLVKKKANRVYKSGAGDMAKAKFGPEAWKPAELKSPAELEKVPAAREWVKEFTFQPDTGLTVAVDTDARMGVKVQRGSEVFKAYIDKAE